MKKIFCIILFFIAVKLFSQPQIYLFTKKIDNGIALFASNAEYCPVSAVISFNLTNLSPTTGNQNIFLIPSKITDYKICDLVLIEANKGYQFSYNFKSNFGDITLEKYDSSFEYDLPFTKENSFKLHQGYNGSFSHQNENALDFTMPKGTEIVAAKSGVVISVIQNNTKFCADKSCINFSNTIIIYHKDGTFANYAHLQYNGSKVNIGDSVTQGSVIGFSGNTGFTSGPHLHFACYLPGLEKKRTVETYFKINDGTETVILEEGNYYSKNY